MGNYKENIQVNVFTPTGKFKCAFFTLGKLYWTSSFLYNLSENALVFILLVSFLQK